MLAPSPRLESRGISMYGEPRLFANVIVELGESFPMLVSEIRSEVPFVLLSRLHRQISMEIVSAKIWRFGPGGCIGLRKYPR